MGIPARRASEGSLPSLARRAGMPCREILMPLDTSSVARIVKAVAPYTMVPPSAIEFSMNQMLAAIDAGLAGVVVECGTWKGGCSFAMLLAQQAAYGQIRRPVYMLDSFEGLPQAEERDGPLARS